MQTIKGYIKCDGCGWFKQGYFIIDDGGRYFCEGCVKAKKQEEKK